MNRETAIRQFIERYPIPQVEKPILVDVGAAGTVGYRALFPGAQYFIADLPGVAGSDRQFDVCVSIPSDLQHVCQGVVCTDTLEHVLDPFAAVQNMSDLLVRGGILYLITVIEWVVHRHPIDCWRFCPDGMEYLLKRSGLDCLEIQLEDKGECDAGRHIYACGRKR